MDERKQDIGNPLTRIVRKDLGITHNDFSRIYPRLCKDWGETIGLTADIEMLTDYHPSIALQTTNNLTGSKIFVKVSEERVRKVGSLKFPYVDLVFWFSGISETEVDHFMGRFDMAFQKGGG